MMTGEYHILVVDDDKSLRDLLAKFLSQHKYRITCAKDAVDADHKMGIFDFDMLIVDVMMPGITGIEFCKKLRQSHHRRIRDIPILMLTAMGEGDDRIKGLEVGVDDYLAKPFEPQELLLRIKAILRRTLSNVSDENIFYVQIGNFYFDLQNGLLTQNGKMVHLTTAEVSLLTILAKSANTVVHRDELIDKCGIQEGGRAIDVQITRLRRKLEKDAKSPEHLVTVRNKGYLLRVN